MGEMSEIRQPSSYMVEDVGVGGMLEDDSPGTVESRLREARLGTGPIMTCADVSSGPDEPEAIDKREATATRVGRVMVRLKDFCRMNGINEVLTASLMGQIAMDMCQ